MQRIRLTVLTLPYVCSQFILGKIIDIVGQILSSTMAANIVHLELGGCMSIMIIAFKILLLVIN